MILGLRKLFTIAIFICTAASAVAAQNSPRIVAFKENLDGLWIKTEKDGSHSIINYDRKSEELTLFSSSQGIMEVYMCSDFRATLDGISYYLTGTDDMIPFIKVNVIIRMDGEKCWFTVQESDINNRNIVWTGCYSRMTASKDKKSAQGSKTLPTLEGRYFCRNRCIDFSENSFTLTENGTEESGIFALYNFEETQILELRFSEGDGRTSRMDQYKIEWTKNSIALTPGRLTAHGFKLSGRESATFSRALPEPQPPLDNF